MLDEYQIQLTRMLEAEQFEEAKRLLHFLLQCQGQDDVHYSEWESLLEWLNMAFPAYETEDALQTADQADDDPYGEEERLRAELLKSEQLDEAYMNQIVYIIQNHPMLEQQLLALERAVYMSLPLIDDQLIQWLESEQIHPVLQFKTLQCLKRRGVDRSVTLERMGEKVTLAVADTPLSLSEYPEPILAILKKTESVIEQDDPTLPYFAMELWKDCLQFLYGTATYARMADEKVLSTQCFAAALHLTLCLTVYGRANDDEIRDLYEINDSSRFCYEQACRVLRQVAVLLQGNGDEHQP
ncbi:hypothetical protein [Paenibacillus sp. IITD108]|uniref:hypothetical protein n=1 Tax=Paenibacillus sp. IITD108 TaxID=3116649 RepID=UPI002F41D038